jgi:hypothetical protein
MDNHIIEVMHAWQDANDVYTRSRAEGDRVAANAAWDAYAAACGEAGQCLNPHCTEPATVDTGMNGMRCEAHAKRDWNVGREFQNLLTAMLLIRSDDPTDEEQRSNVETLVEEVLEILGEGDYLDRDGVWRVFRASSWRPGPNAPEPDELIADHLAHLARMAEIFAGTEGEP